MTEKKQGAPSFEQALARLEELVREMEGGQLPLEKMMAHFEEGSELVKLCTKTLNEVEKKIEVLVRKGDGVESKPLDSRDLDAT